jgi:hypothetical protein
LFLLASKPAVFPTYLWLFSIVAAYVSATPATQVANLAVRAAPAVARNPPSRHHLTHLAYAVVTMIAPCFTRHKVTAALLPPLPTRVLFNVAAKVGANYASGVDR